MGESIIHPSIHQSCEIILDGHQIAKNAPLPGKSNRSVKPDANRYFETHKWILKPAKRVKFQPGIMDVPQQQQQQQQQQQTGGTRPVKSEEGMNTRPTTPRYNGIRPDYRGKRVSTESYPDPTSFGWTFTGSVEASFVEFFDRQTNMGTVKLDWYYTTATVKTILDHPTTGKNELFRNTVNPEQFAQIMTNPRVHSGRGYRRSEDRPVDIDVKMEDEFDALPTEEINGDSSQADVDVDAAMDTDTGGSSTNANAGSVAASTTYFAKNEAYDFKTQGHMNRRTEMNKLHQSQEYAQWEEAAKREYAVIHAKFYISVPKRKYGPPQSSNNQGRGGRGGGNQGRGRGRGQRRRNLEALPQQTPVIDIKAAEKATLGTDFLATGPAQNRMRSNVRMDRIKGLTDDDEWKGGPLFEHKLYYRAEEVISGAVDIEIDMEEDELEDSYVGALRENVSLSDYKIEKINQVKQYNVENKAYNPEEGEELLLNCQKKIRLCDNSVDIDELVKIFYGELVKGEFYGNTQVGPVAIEHV